MFGNLAFSGISMGVYSLMMGFIDLSNENVGKFFVNSDQWRESIKCKSAGAMALIAIQSLIFILTVISVERFIKVMYPNSKFVMSVRAAKVSMVFCWTLAVVLGVSIPMLSGPEMYGWSDNCLGLPLHRLYNEFNDIMLDFKSPAGGYDILIPTPDLQKDQPAWPLSIALFLVLDPLCLLVGLILFLIVKFKGIHEELPVDEDLEDDDDDIKKKPVVIDVDHKVGSAVQAESNDGSGPRALPNQYEEPSAPHEYETLDEVKKDGGTGKDAHSDDDNDDDGVGGTTAVEVPKFRPTEGTMSRKMTKRKGTGKKVKVLKGSKLKKKSLKKKTSHAPGDQIATVTDGVVLSTGDPITIGGVSIMKSGDKGGGDVANQKFDSLEGADLVMNKDDIEAGDEGTCGNEGKRKKKKRRRRKKKVEGDDDVEKGKENQGMNEENEEGEPKKMEDGDEDKEGSEWETDTSASDDDDDDDESSSDEDIVIEIEERRITSKNLATKMMRLFIFDLLILSPIFVMGIMAQAGAIDMPMDFAYWAALFIIPFMFCLNPFVICCVDIGGIRPKYEWQFDEVSYSETLSEKRERIAREAMTFL